MFYLNWLKLDQNLFEFSSTRTGLKLSHIEVTKIWLKLKSMLVQKKTKTKSKMAAKNNTGMAHACLYALTTMSGHAPDDSADGVLGELLPDLDMDISELLDSLWLYLALLDAPIQNVP